MRFPLNRPPRAVRWGTVRPAVPACLALSLASAGCAAFEPAYVYSPSPAREPVMRDVERVGVVEARVVGARRSSGTEPAALVVNVRVQRDGETPVALAPERTRMTTGTRRGLRLGAVDVGGPLVPAAGGAAAFTAVFELIPPADLADLDFDVLTLHADLDVGRAMTPVRLAFRRDEPEHAWWDPWRGPGPGTKLEDAVLSYGIDVGR
ncbi:MAG: hypothetical protein HMLKMBBP_01189 [Planctomycetes bacterium]|nr:hypothetical protein [Planctomycetota bacterium]